MTIQADSISGPSSENQQNVYNLQLSGRCMQISDSEDNLLWQTDSNVKVSDYLTGDIDHDGRPEILLLTWKRGSYGNHRPFWVEKDTWHFTQHIYIYELYKKSVRPVWMSSALEFNIREWVLNENGVLILTDPEGTDTRWAWISWGLKQIDG